MRHSRTSTLTRNPGQHTGCKSEFRFFLPLLARPPISQWHARSHGRQWGALKLPHKPESRVQTLAVFQKSVPLHFHRLSVPCSNSWLTMKCSKLALLAYYLKEKWILGCRHNSLADCTTQLRSTKPTNELKCLYNDRRVTQDRGQGVSRNPALATPIKSGKTQK